jgi:hypothetical protein
MDIRRLFYVEQVPDEQVERAGLDGERLEALVGETTIHHERAQAQATGEENTEVDEASTEEGQLLEQGEAVERW